MAPEHTIFHTGFGQQSFAIDCSNEDALQIARFLFGDLPGAGSGSGPKRFDIVFSGPQPMVSLWDGEKRLYFGKSTYQLAYILMNEVIYHCIISDKESIALHAGAVYNGKRCLLLPGKSGNGKSTLTTWLSQNGYQYLTDELVFLREDGTVNGFPRPVNLKVTPGHPSWLIPDDCVTDVLSGKAGSMIPHRLLNPDFRFVSPLLTDIVFPEYSEGSPLVFEEISPARSCLHLLQSHVNARSLEEHGIPRLSATIRNCRSYRLVYSRFSDLQTLF